MAGAYAGVVTLLFGRFQGRHRRPESAALIDESRQSGSVDGRGLRQRMVGRHREEARTEQRVGPRRIGVERGLQARHGRGIELPADRQALGSSDPVALHQAHFLGPLVERIQPVEQVLRVIRDLEEPLDEVALLDDRTRAPAASIDHLLVGQDCVVDGVPIDLGPFPVDEAGVEKIEKDALLLLVVARIACRDLAAPVDRQTHALQLRPHGGDIVIGPFGRVPLVLHGGVFGRQAEGVPSHRMEDVEPFGPAVPRHDIAHGVVAHMAHVDAPGGIWEHLEDVIFRARVLVRGLEGLAFLPHRLPMGFGNAGVVAVGQHHLPSGGTHSS